MSVEETGARQRERLVELGLGIVDLPPLLDVDTIANARTRRRARPADPLREGVRGDGAARVSAGDVRRRRR